MRIRLGNGLLPLITLVLVLDVIIYFLPNDVIRIILGFPFVLLFPGYTLSVALLPAKTSVSGLVRLTLSIGLSIAIVVVLGLILNYTRWGVTLESTFIVTIVFILITSAIAILRQKRLTETERFVIEFILVLPWRRWSIWERAISIVLVLIILGALGTAIYVLANPNPGQKFTEFYILGEQGNARDYPRELIVGQPGVIILGIVNHEYASMDYRIDVSLNGSKFAELGGIALKHEEKWENKYSFVPSVSGLNQVMEFILYKNGKIDARAVPLRLHVNVSASP